MTQAVDVSLPVSRRQEYGLIGGVCVAHFISHYYFMVLPPLLIFVRADFGVSYTEIGLALAVFNIVSTIFQTPVGFLVDRIGGRLNLIAGLLLGAVSLAVAGLADSYWVFIAMFGVLGLANTVYHPADYALLSAHARGERMAQVFSLHTFSGMLGGALAPPTMLFAAAYYGWRGAFVAAGILGAISALILIVQREPPLQSPKEPHTHASTASLSGWRLLLSPPIMINLVFFMLMSMQGGGLTNFLVVALGDLHQTPVILANTALTTMLFTTAAGVLLGGLILTRTGNHTAVANICLIVIAVTSAMLAFDDFGTIGLLAVISISGLAGGVITPSRDMIVRAVTPPGAFGAVFGFVTNGFTIAGIASPIMFGLMMDYGAPRWIFFTVAISALLGIVTVIAGRRWSHG